MISPTASRPNRSSTIGLTSTTLGGLTLLSTSERQTWHTSAKRRYKKRHEHKPDAS